MNEISSGTFVVLKTGGPKLKVKWYLDPTHVEVSWYHKNIEQFKILDVDDLEIWDDDAALDIDVIAVIIQPPVNN